MMKKLLLIVSVFCLFILSTVVAKAQNTTTFGIKGGLNYNVMTTKYIDSQDKPDEVNNPKGIGFHVGFYLVSMFSPKVGIRPELVVSRIGTKQEESSTYTTNNGFYNQTYSDEYKIQSNFTYIDIPFLLHIAATENFSIQFGPQLGILFGVKYKEEGTSTYTSGTTVEKSSFSFESSSKEGISGVDLGAAFGLNYKLNSGLNFGLRYHRSLNSINSTDKEYALARWNVVQLSIGYTFSKK